MKWWRK